MTRRPKRRKPARQPQVFLVGNSGKVRRDKRLRQLRMTKKYKTFLMEQEREKMPRYCEHVYNFSHSIGKKMKHRYQSFTRIDFICDY